MTVRVIHGDMREELPKLGREIHSIVTDPPYHLTSIVKRFANTSTDREPFAATNPTKAYANLSRGFMGKAWDGGDIAFQAATWRLCFDLLPPGGHLLAFAGTRTYHRMACAIEDAGFEMRDTIMYLYGSGFPKSRRVNQSPMFCQCGEAGRNGEYKAPEHMPGDHIDTVDALERGGLPPRDARHLTNTKPDYPDDYRLGHGSDDGQLPLAEAVGQSSLPSQAHAQAHIRSFALDDDRAGGSSHTLSPVQRSALPSNLDCSRPSQCASDEQASILSSTSRADISGSEPDKSGNGQGLSSADYAKGFPRCPICGKPNADGYGTALKPACELICVARKPLVGTVAANVLAHGTGALNIDGCRVEAAETLGRLNHTTSKFIDSANGSRDAHARTILVDNSGDKGRWPANLCHDGSDEVVKAFPDTAPSLPGSGGDYGGFSGLDNDGPKPPIRGHADNGGSAARFYYSAKADAADRLGSVHPTVKPVDLMRWLVRLVTPPGGTCLDPFAGSGTTGMACMAEGFDCIMVEREAEYVADIKARIAHVHGTDTPLFAVAAE